MDGQEKRQAQQREDSVFYCMLNTYLVHLSLVPPCSPLTKVKLINELNEREASLGVKENVSWHSEYKDSAWIFIGKRLCQRHPCD